MGAPCANSRRLRWGSERFKIVAYIAYIAYNFYFDMPPGRPASIRTRYFSRRISDNDAAILAHAGDGDISLGFKNILDLYCQTVNMSKSNGTSESHSTDEYKDNGE